MQLRLPICFLYLEPDHYRHHYSHLHSRKVENWMCSFEYKYASHHESDTDTTAVTVYSVIMQSPCISTYMSGF
jgi:hypothetical protein